MERSLKDHRHKVLRFECGPQEGKRFVSSAEKFLSLATERTVFFKDQSCKVENKWFWQSSQSQVGEHQTAVVWFLEHKLSCLSRLLSQVSDLVRESLKPLEPLNMKPLPTAHLKSPVAEEWSPEQVSVLQQEQRVFLSQVSELSSSMRQAQTDVSEISRLQGTLQEHIAFQAANIERLFDDAANALGLVDQGNSYLARAANSPHAFRNAIVSIVMSLAMVLLALHYFSD